MKCAQCGCMDSKVVDSRPTDEGSAIRRRRECVQCQFRFTTYEKIELMPLVVAKKDGSREAFDAEKLKRGLLKAVEKRPIALSQVDRIVTDIETQLQNSLEQEVSSQQIGEMVMQRLKKVDEVAYVRFASVYRHFEDIQSFRRQLEELLRDQRRRK